MVAVLLKHGTNARALNSSLIFALRMTGENPANMIILLLQHGANPYAALKWACKNKNLAAVTKLLECGADAYCDNKGILIHLQKHFDEELADIILPYCDPIDYCYFPEDYIRRRIVPTKSANKN